MQSIVILFALLGLDSAWYPQIPSLEICRLTADRACQDAQLCLSAEPWAEAQGEDSLARVRAAYAYSARVSDVWNKIKWIKTGRHWVGPWYPGELADLERQAREMVGNEAFDTGRLPLPLYLER